MAANARKIKKPGRHAQGPLHPVSRNMANKRKSLEMSGKTELEEGSAHLNPPVLFVRPGGIFVPYPAPTAATPASQGLFPDGGVAVWPPATGTITGGGTNGTKWHGESENLAPERAPQIRRNANSGTKWENMGLHRKNSVLFLPRHIPFPFQFPFLSDCRTRFLIPPSHSPGQMRCCSKGMAR